MTQSEVPVSNPYSALPLSNLLVAASVLCDASKVCGVSWENLADELLARAEGMAED